MKQTLLITTLLLGCNRLISAQTWHNPLPIDSTWHRVTYTGVVQVPGASQAELYSRAREWFANTFGSSKAVLEMDDREVGKLIGHANQQFVWAGGVGSAPCRMWRTIKVEVKDSRYRYTLTDFTMTIGEEPETTAKPIERWFTPSWATFNKDGSPKKIVASIITAAQSSGEGEAASLQAAMTKKGSGDF